MSLNRATSIAPLLVSRVTAILPMPSVESLNKGVLQIKMESVNIPGSKVASHLINQRECERGGRGTTEARWVCRCVSKCV